MKDEAKQGDAILDVRLVDKRTAKPVPNAVIFAKRIDMAPDSMEEMTSKIEQLPSPEPGIYRFKAKLTMAGGWRLSLGPRSRARPAPSRASWSSRPPNEPVGMACRDPRRARGGGYRLLGGARGSPVPALVERARTEFAHWLPGSADGFHVPVQVPTKATGPVVYYQDPDGKPVFASEPTRTADGRDYRAVHASEDSASRPRSPRRRCRWRPATSPPGRGEAHPLLPQPDGAARHLADAEERLDGDGLPARLRGRGHRRRHRPVSPGKLQRTGVRTESRSVACCPCRCGRRAPSRRTSAGSRDRDAHRRLHREGRGRHNRGPRP